MAELLLRVVSARLRQASYADRELGLLGFVTCELEGGIELGGIALRRSQSGRIYLTYPARRGRDGERRYSVRPTSEEVRQRLEREILHALGDVSA